MKEIIKCKQIGWYIVSEETTFTNHFETAAWYEDVSVAPGKYPIVMHDYWEEDDGQVRGFIDSIYVSMPGKIVSDDFQSLLCGVPVGSYDCSKNKGKDATAHFDCYTYMAARKIFEGDTEFELLPEYEVREYLSYISDDGSERKMYEIYKKQNAD